MKFAVIVFPGSNCDVDMFHAIKDELGEEVDYVWHDTENLDEYDAILLPGGMNLASAMKAGAEQGKPILGVCNGFQILVESGLLPGALMRNENLKFMCRTVQLRVENNETMFTSQYGKDEVINIPIAHGEGNYYCDEATLKQLEENNQIAFRYVENPNGSVSDIAGIVNEKGNVLGMMPHPERAVDELLGGAEGLKVFQSILKQWRETYVVNA